MAQLVKNLPAMWETWVQSLGWEDPLEKGKAIPTPVFWPGGFHGLYSPWGRKESDTIEPLPLRFTSYIRSNASGGAVLVKVSLNIIGPLSFPSPTLPF